LRYSYKRLVLFPSSGMILFTIIKIIFIMTYSSLLRQPNKSNLLPLLNGTNTERYTFKKNIRKIKSFTGEKGR